MTPGRNHEAVNEDLAILMAAFFSAVSFETAEVPPYENIHGLFDEAGLLIKGSGAMPEISTVPQFIQSRHATVLLGELTRFQEMELSATTEVFGNVAHRFSAYAKSGTLRGVTFHTRGAISTQFIRTPAGWKISAMAWDDESRGLSLPQAHVRTE